MLIKSWHNTQNALNEKYLNSLNDIGTIIFKDNYIHEKIFFESNSPILFRTQL